jgi:dihydroxyacetone kinase-like predicted kinase
LALRLTCGLLRGVVVVDAGAAGVVVLLLAFISIIIIDKRS